MRIIKKSPTPVTAFPLGEGHPLEAQLLERGLLRRRPDGTYEVFSREATGGTGQLARPGDFVKLDSGGMPYPNTRDYFLQHHDRLPDGAYVQRPVPLTAWQVGEPVTDGMAFLLERGLLRIQKDDPDRYFSATLWGAPLTAPSDAVVVFYDLTRDKDGHVTDATFNFVAREQFTQTYDVLE